jgi:alkylation response protein AidB-like acyl-CoA dehydrogenase
VLPILVYGNEEQKACFVPYVVRGLKIGCFALTEQTT